MPRYTTQFGFQSNSLIPRAMKTIIVINVVVYILTSWILPFLSYSGISLGYVFESFFALKPFDSETFYPYWQLITYQFMHGGFTHLAFNMLALWMFGSELEQIWGSARFVTYYLLSGIGGGILHLAIEPGTAVGASGAIMGVLVGFGMMFPDRPVMMFPIFIPIPARIFVLLYALIDLFAGFSSSSDGVAHFAHLGGAIAGFLLVKFGESSGLYGFVQRVGQSVSSGRGGAPMGRKVIDARYRDIPQASTVASPSGVFHGGSFFYKGEYITEDTVNIILEKISRSGYDSLDQREKEILMEISRRMN